MRTNLRQAIRLFKEAGYEVRDQQLVNAKTGEPFTVEFLADDPSFERVFLFFRPSLERVGITVSVRSVDDAQYESRLRTWDFDITKAAWGESLTPGNEQRTYWGSQAADEPGSLNLMGIKNPAVDAMIEHVSLCQEPRRSCCRNQGARPRVALEPLRRAAVDLQQSA